MDRYKSKSGLYAFMPLIAYYLDFGYTPSAGGFMDFGEHFFSIMAAFPLWHIFGTEGVVKFGLYYHLLVMLIIYSVIVLLRNYFKDKKTHV